MYRVLRGIVVFFVYTGVVRTKCKVGGGDVCGYDLSVWDRLCRVQKGKEI